MRVLQVVASLAEEWGGPPRVAVHLAEALHCRGIRSSIFATRYPENGHLITSDLIEVSAFRKGFMSSLWTAHSSRLASELNAVVREFDIVHIHELWHFPHYAAYKAAKSAGVPFVITVHGELDPWVLRYRSIRKRIYWRLMQRSILANAAVLHAISQPEVGQIRSLGVKTPTRVIPNGIPKSEIAYPSDPGTFLSLHPELYGKRIILFLGRLHPKKGLDLLGDAFAAIERESHFDDVRLVIAGPDEGGYRAELEKRLASRGVISKTVFTGMLTGDVKRSALDSADVFVLPSYSEGFSISVLEALARATPVVITTGCNFPQVGEAGAGKVIEPIADHLTQALREILDDSVLGDRMGDLGRKLVQNQYTWDRVAERMSHLYESALESDLVVADS